MDLGSELSAVRELDSATLVMIIVWGKEWGRICKARLPLDDSCQSWLGLWVETDDYEDRCSLNFHCSR